MHAVTRIKKLCQVRAISISQVITGTIALGVVYDSLNSQVALGNTNVHVDLPFEPDSTKQNILRKIET